MSVLSPVTSVFSAILPVVFAVAFGTHLSPVAVASIIVTIVAVILVSVSRSTSGSRLTVRGLVTAVVAGCGFGGLILAYDLTSPADGVAPLLIARSIVLRERLTTIQMGGIGLGIVASVVLALSSRLPSHLENLVLRRPRACTRPMAAHPGYDVYDVYMRFMMLVLSDPSPDAPADESDVALWVEQLDSRRERLVGDILDPSLATVVRVRGGERLITEGASETLSSLWGFDVLECVDLARAVELAALHPMARNGRIEIRPFPTE